jgi:alpha-glucosidase (family GH31 glycosyl hydrolase)
MNRKKTMYACIVFFAVAVGIIAAPTPIAVHTYPMIPKWALGYWQTGFLPVPATTASEAIRIGQLIHSKGHPGDVWICDLGGWNTGSNFTSMDWNSSNFPDPAAFIRQMNQNHWHIGQNYHGYPSSSTDQNFFSKLKRDLDYGSEVIWMDMRSTASVPWIWNYIRDYNKSKGGNRVVMLNFWGSYTYGAQDQPSGWNLGANGIYPVYWTGDIETSWRCYHDQIKRITHDNALQGAFTLNMDTPGFDSLPMNNYVELTARTVQFSDFTAISRQHGQGGRLPVVDAAVQPTVNQAMIFSRILRYRLIPYIYTCYWNMYDQAMPLVRPLELAFPNDADAKSRYYQYMFGDALLVAPVNADVHESASNPIVRGAVSSGLTKMNIYFPKGETWIDYWSHQVYQGGTSVDYPTNDTLRIPLFVRKGSIIPMGPQILWVDPAVHSDPMTLDIYPPDPGSEATFTLYDDDGQTYGYENGQYALTSMSCKSSAGDSLIVSIGTDQGTFGGKPAQRTYVLKINMQAHAPSTVTIGGTSAPMQMVGQILGQGTSDGWAFDSTSSTLYVRTMRSTGSGTSVNVSQSGNAIRVDMPAIIPAADADAFLNPLSSAALYRIMQKKGLKIYDLKGNCVKFNQIRGYGIYLAKAKEQITRKIIVRE